MGSKDFNAADIALSPIAWTMGTNPCSPGTYNPIGQGPYDHRASSGRGYSYDQLGSILTLAGRTYEYSGSGHAHAVRYAYKYGDGGRFDSFTTVPVSWTMTSCDQCSLSVLVDGEKVARHGGLLTASTAYRSDTSALAAGDAIQIEFKVDKGYTDADATLQLEDSTPNNTFGIIATPGQNLRVRYRASGGAAQYVGFSPAFTLAANTWYVLRLEAGNGTSKARVSVWKREDPSVRGFYESAEAGWNNVNWRFRTYANSQSPESPTWLTLDSYFELKSSAASV